jgi:hypothetical protein
MNPNKMSWLIVAAVVLIACMMYDGRTAGEEKSAPKLTKWEYTVNRGTLDEWNKLGSEGWELVATWGEHGTFKRPKQ